MFKGIGLVLGGMLKGLKGLGAFFKNPFGAILGGISLGLASLGKLAGKIPGLPTIKQFFIKGIPKMFGFMFKGLHAMMIGIGAGLGAFFSMFKLGLPAFGIPGLSGVGELLQATGSFMGGLLMDMGDAVLDMFKFGADMVLGILEAGWNFAGDILLMLGPLVVKFFEGVLWMIKFLFDMLGKVVIGAFKLLLKSPKLIWGGIKLVGAMFGKLGPMIKGAFDLLGKALSPVLAIGAMIGRFAVGLAKLGFGLAGKAIVGLIKIIPWLLKKLGVGIGWLIKMAMRGLIAGLSLGFKGLIGGLKLAFKGLGKLLKGALSMAGGLLKLGLAGLKGMWNGLKKGLSVGASLLGGALKFLKTADPRVIASAIVIGMYCLYKCMYGGWCQRTYQKPGWGKPGTHEISDLNLAEQGHRLKGGSSKPSWMKRSRDARLGRTSNGKFKLFKTPELHVADVQNNEDRGGGLYATHEPAIYQEPSGVDWEKKEGDVQVQELDRSPSIAKIDMSESDKWTESPGKPSVSGHPTIVLKNSSNTVRVQMHDMETGKIHWDEVYSPQKHGMLDNTAKNISSGGMLPGGNAKPPPGGWKPFQRLSADAGDPVNHQYEMKITKYPPTPHTSGNEAGEEANFVGSAHFNVHVEQDPSPPSEKAAHHDAAPVVTGSSMGFSSVVLAATPDSTEHVIRLPVATPYAMCSWRHQRHRDFWSEGTSSRSRSSSQAARSRGSTKASCPLSMRRQGDIFFASPREGRRSMMTQ